MTYKAVRTSDRLPRKAQQYVVITNSGVLGVDHWHEKGIVQNQEFAWKGAYAYWLEKVPDEDPGLKEQMAMAKTDLLMAKDQIEYSGDGETGV